ncbi:MAG: PH domain-containing protein [Polyangiaceae bacterium]
MSRRRSSQRGAGKPKEGGSGPWSARRFVPRKGFLRSFAALSLAWTICFGMTCGLALDGSAQSRELLLSTILLTVGWLLFGIFTWVVSRRDVGVEGKVEVQGDAVTFDGERLCGREEIETALLIPGPRRPVVSLKRRTGRPIRLEFSERSEGQELIVALGLSPHQRVAKLSLPAMNQRARAAAFACAAAMGLTSLVAVPLLGSWLPALGAVLAVGLYAVFGLLTRTTLQVGGDGLTIRYLGRTRFIHHDDIVRVATWATSHTGVEVTLRSGEILRLPTATHLEGDGGVASGIADLLETVRSTAREDTAREESLLARRGRSGAEWLRRMRGLAMGANADHRTAPMDPARAWRVLENPSVEESARVGAAVLLATIADENERARLRVAASAIAGPAVRVAIDAVISGEEDEAVIEALDAVQGAESPPRRVHERA